MTGNSTTLHYESEFLKGSWNSRSYVFVLSCPFTLKKENKERMVKKKTDVEISSG